MYATFFFPEEYRKCGLLALDSSDNPSNNLTGVWYGISCCSVKSHIGLLRTAFFRSAFVDELQ